VVKAPSCSTTGIPFHQRSAGQRADTDTQAATNGATDRTGTRRPPTAERPRRATRKVRPRMRLQTVPSSFTRAADPVRIPVAKSSERVGG
jgi:hypothetical protein